MKFKRATTEPGVIVGRAPTPARTRLFVVTGCGTCPNLVKERTQGAGYALDWKCKAAGRDIKGYIEYPSEEPRAGSFPDFCPLEKR